MEAHDQLYRPIDHPIRENGKPGNGIAERSSVCLAGHRRRDEPDLRRHVA